MTATDLNPLVSTATVRLCTCFSDDGSHPGLEQRGQDEGDDRVGLPSSSRHRRTPCPLPERQIARDDDATALVAPGTYLEEGNSLLAAHRHVAALVDNQETVRVRDLPRSHRQFPDQDQQRSGFSATTARSSCSLMRSLNDAASARADKSRAPLRPSGRTPARSGAKTAWN